MLDWILLPVMLAGAIYMLYRKFRRTRGKDRPGGCGGCPAAGECARAGAGRSPECNEIDSPGK